MNHEPELIKDTIQWQRKILNGYWIVVLIYLIAAFVALFIKIKLQASNLKAFVIYTMMIPTAIQVLLIGINELLEKYYKKPRPYTMIVTGVLISAVLIYGNKTVVGMQYVMMIPMLVAAFHFKRKYLSFAFLIVIPVLAALYLMFPIIWNHMTIFEKFALFYILSGQYFILVQLLHRGNDLLEQLIKTARSERDLMIQNTIMERLSKTDALTDLYNHRMFQECFDRMIDHCEENKLPLQIAIIDIDNFKSINDTYGHAVGDIILKRVAKVLENSFTSDQVLARYGGEEFAVLFPASTFEQALERCEHARQSIWELNHPEMGNRKVTVSIGLSKYVSGMGKSHFFNDADALLYQAKRNGKNKIIYSAM